MDFEDDRGVDPDRDDLARVAEQLGDPLTVHTTRISRVVFRLVLGIILVAVLGVLHVLFWSGQIPWPAAGKLKIWFLIILLGIAGPGYGVYLIVFALRGRNQMVMTYPQGIFARHHGLLTAMPWKEVVAVQVSGLKEDNTYVREQLADGPSVGWFKDVGAKRRLSGYSVTIMRLDGTSMELSSALSDYPELVRRIQVESFGGLEAKFLDLLACGMEVAFGNVTISDQGIHGGSEILKWAEVETVRIKGDNLEIRKKGKWGAWKKVDPDESVNLHVLMAFVERGMATGRVTSEASRRLPIPADVDLEGTSEVNGRDDGNPVDDREFSDDRSRDFDDVDRRDDADPRRRRFGAE